MNFSLLLRNDWGFRRICSQRNFQIYNIIVNNHGFNIRNLSIGKSNFQLLKNSSNGYNNSNKKVKSIKNYVLAAAVLTLGLSYAAVPLYRIFCQASGFGGTVKHDIGGDKVEKLKKVTHRPITVKFNSDVSATLKWKFKPQQKEIVVIPGETALAFYTATNPLDVPIVGISTYNILPYEAAQYFNKIQCFCFEEQQLNPKEQVDMPVFFYIDPEFCEDPYMENVNEVILSYTFFQAKEGMSLPFGRQFEKNPAVK